MDHRLRVDHDKYLFPLGPEPSRQNPEELIEGNQLRPRMPLLEDCKLLAKS